MLSGSFSGREFAALPFSLLCFVWGSFSAIRFTSRSRRACILPCFDYLCSAFSCLLGLYIVKIVFPLCVCLSCESKLFSELSKYICLMAFGPFCSGSSLSCPVFVFLCSNNAHLLVSNRSLYANASDHYRLLPFRG